MHPELFSIFGITITYYGLLVAVGIVYGIFTSQRLAKYLNIKPEIVFDLAFYAVIIAVIVSRVFYIMLNFEYFLENPSHLIFSRGGFVFLGGLAGGAIYVMIILKIKKLSVKKIGDIFACVLPLGHSIGRQGCLLNGCCHGKPVSCEIPFSVHMHGHFGCVIPTQLFESLGLFIIFTILISLFKSERQRGKLFLLYMILYAILRFTLEFFRGDYDHYYFFNLTFSQLIILLLIPVLSFLYLRLLKNESK